MRRLIRGRLARRLGAGALLVLLVACGDEMAAPIQTPLVVVCENETGPLTAPPVVGKRVVFTANTVYEGHPCEIWVTDTAGTAQSPVLMKRFPTDSSIRTDQPFVSASGAYFGARAAAYANTVDGCPASMHIVTAATGAVTSGYPQGGSACLRELRFNGDGSALAMRFELAGVSGAKLGTSTQSSFPVTVQSVDTSTAQAGGSVQKFRWSVDHDTVVWTEAGGLYSSPVFTPGGPHQRSTDVPADLAVGQLGGLDYAVYVAPGEARLRTTLVEPFAAQSQAYLTNALAAGDTLGAIVLSPDGSTLLYEARIAGVWQLWMVALAAPLAEQRVDAAAPIVTTSTEDSLNGRGTRFAFNTDSTRFAWTGDTGGGVLRVHAATIVAPTVATVLTPPNERVYREMFWSDADTLVYEEWGLGVSATPHSSLPNLRAVTLGAPLSTVALWSALVGNSDDILYDVDLCSDGSVVYETGNVEFNLNFEGAAFNGLYAVHPDVPSGLHQITSVIGSWETKASGIAEFDCQ